MESYARPNGDLYVLAKAVNLAQTATEKISWNGGVKNWLEWWMSEKMTMGGSIDLTTPSNQLELWNY